MTPTIHVLFARGFAVVLLSVVGGQAAGILRFVEPSPFSMQFTGAEVPIVLSAVIDDDLITTADVFVDGVRLGTAQYCCPFCPCARPLPGEELILQIPRDPTGGIPSGNPWQGWTNPPPGLHTLKARGVSEQGVTVESPDVQVVVRAPFDLGLRIRSNGEGTLIFTIPDAPLVGPFDLQKSRDCTTWSRVGRFVVGDMAAYQWDTPDPKDDQPWFYRSIPATGP